MALKLMGKKRGMTQVFDDQGNVIVCTVIEAEPNVVVQIKTTETDGYNAVQLGFEKVQAKDPRRLAARVGKPQQVRFQKAGVEPRRYLSESRLDAVDGYSVGQEVGLGAFAQIPYVDVTGRSKGKGYQGVIKLHNFAGGPAAHGSSFHRHAGSTGMRTTPGRCLPNSPRASHMGHEMVTVQNLRIVAINEAEHIILIEGAIPGPRDSLVYISQAKKKAPQESKSTGVKLWQN